MTSRTAEDARRFQSIKTIKAYPSDDCNLRVWIPNCFLDWKYGMASYACDSGNDRPSKEESIFHEDELVQLELDQKIPINILSRRRGAFSYGSQSSPGRCTGPRTEVSWTCYSNHRALDFFVTTHTFLFFLIVDFKPKFWEVQSD